MRIYTRTGDRGDTGLFGGQRVSKDHLRVAAYGEVDELNAALGVALAVECHPDLREELEHVQGELFTLGADLATPPAAGAAPGGRAVPRVTPAMAERLEGAIDRFEAELEPLRQFILPGGVTAAAQLHFARAVCRRAERRVVALAAAEPVGDAIVPYLNRLSDLLFVLARVANHRSGQAEKPWVAGGDVTG